jgi:hypothetical protein
VTNGDLTGSQGVYIGAPGSFPNTPATIHYFRDVVFAAGGDGEPMACISGEKFVSVTGPDGPFVRNSVTVDGGALVPPENLNDLPMAFFGGTPVSYKFVITNCGTATLHNVRIDDCIDLRSVGDDGFLLGGANGNCVEDPRLIPPSRTVKDLLEPGQSVTVTSADFPNDPISSVNICETFGRDRIDGIVRNDSQVEAEADLDGVGGGETFIDFDDLNLVQCKNQLAALGDRVWEDLDADGIQDCSDTNGNGILGDVDPAFPNDPTKSDQGVECGDKVSGGAGIAGVPVHLFQPDGNGDCTVDLGRQVVSGTDGLYLFPDLVPGDYCVQFGQPPANFCDTDGFELGAPQFTAQNVGNDEETDSDADPTDGKTDSLTLGAGETNRTLDAGFVCPAKIGNLLWEDTNQDGLQNGEPGIGGVTVNLFDCGPDGVAGTGDDIDTGESRVTDNVDGMYMFGAEPGVFDLAPGDYYVKFDPASFPAGFDFTVPKVGGDDSIDSDCLPPNGISACVTLGSRDINLDRDCGLIPPPPPECAG